MPLYAISSIPLPSQSEHPIPHQPPYDPTHLCTITRHSSNVAHLPTDFGLIHSRLQHGIYAEHVIIDGCGVFFWSFQRGYPVDRHLYGRS